MKKNVAAAVAMAVSMIAFAPHATAKGGGSAMLVPAGDLKWADVPGMTGLKMAVVEGDPAKGPNFTNSFTAFGPTPMYISATPPVTVGQQYFYPYFRLGEAAGALNRYVYDLQFEYIGAIPANVSPTLRRADLATVDATYHSSSPGRSELDGRISIAPWQGGASFTPTPLTAPLRRTEYVLPQPDARHDPGAVHQARGPDLDHQAAHGRDGPRPLISSRHAHPP